MSESHRLPTLSAIIQCKCPVCTQGDMFKTSAINLKRFNELKEKCEVCGYGFQPEPGFYQMSLYFTYAISIGILVIFGFGTYFLLDGPSLWVIYVAVLIPAILSIPWNIRYSKVMVLYIFGGAPKSGRNN